MRHYDVKEDVWKHKDGSEHSAKGPFGCMRCAIERRKVGEAAHAALDAKTSNVPLLPLRISFRQALLLLLADGRERGHGDLLAYFAPEDAGGAAEMLGRLAEEGEIVRGREPGGAWRYRLSRRSGSDT